MSGSKAHWEQVYRERGPEEVSWHQRSPERSLSLIRLAAVPAGGRVVDVGGGASTLVDHLLDEGFRVTVLDISAAGLAHAKSRLGQKAAQVEWVESDAADFAPKEPYDLWHDRAVFHFFTEEEARRRYVAAAARAVRPGGALILAAFSLEGPEKCSGLPVRRYDGASIKKEFEPAFELVREDAEAHQTPWKTIQKFAYFVFRRRA